MNIWCDLRKALESFGWDILQFGLPSISFGMWLNNPWAGLFLFYVWSYFDSFKLTIEHQE